MNTNKRIYNSKERLDKLCLDIRNKFPGIDIKEVGLDRDENDKSRITLTMEEGKYTIKEVVDFINTLPDDVYRQG